MIKFYSLIIFFLMDLFGDYMSICLFVLFVYSFYEVSIISYSDLVVFLIRRFEKILVIEIYLISGIKVVSVYVFVVFMKY